MIEVDNKFDTIVVVHDGKTFVFTGDKTEVSCDTNITEDYIKDKSGHPILRTASYGDAFVTIKMRLIK